MIEGVFGLPGSGKTTYLCKLAQKAIRSGKKVYTSFYCKGCYTLDFDSLGRCDYSDCLILIDEISLLCDSRSWKDYKEHTKYFFALHRHYNVKIIYCSQSYDDCDKRIRNLTDNLYYITSSLFGFSRVRSIVKSMSIYKGNITDSYDVVGLGHFFRRSKYYKYFDSFEKKELPPNVEKLW